MPRRPLLPLLALIIVSLAMASCSAREEAPQDPDDTGQPPIEDTTPREDTAIDVADTSTEPPTFEARSIEGRWIAGDFHVHATGASNDAAPESTRARIKEVAVERGLDFVVLTDHSNSTGSDPTTLDEDPELFNQGPEFPFWERAAELSDASFIMVQGNEISPVNPNVGRPTGHVGCIPRSLTNFDPNVAFIDRPRGEVTGGDALDQAIHVGCFAILNHPYGVNWISYDWTSDAYQGMEVWNGGAGFSSWDRQALDAWACDLSRGRRVTAVGGSDNHKIEVEPPGTLLDPPLGVPTTYVWGASLDWDEVVTSLDARRVSISDTGRPLELDVHAGDGRWLGMTGDEVASEDALWLRVRGHLSNVPDGEERRLKVYRVPPDSCDDNRTPNTIRVPTPNLDILYDELVTNDTEIDLTLGITPAPGDAFFAFVGPENTRMQEAGVSLTNPVFTR
ncbi:MAG: CehA/McbA family metallohydrolase [Bradymonadaceae bacterium]